MNIHDQAGLRSRSQLISFRVRNEQLAAPAKKYYYQHLMQILASVGSFILYCIWEVSEGFFQARHELLITVLWKEGGCVVGMADDDGCKAAECCMN